MGFITNYSTIKQTTIWEKCLGNMFQASNEQIQALKTNISPEKSWLVQMIHFLFKLVPFEGFWGDMR